MQIKLSWTQLEELERVIRQIRNLQWCPKGELKDDSNVTLVEWDKDEVKVNISD